MGYLRASLWIVVIVVSFLIGLGATVFTGQNGLWGQIAYIDAFIIVVAVSYLASSLVSLVIVVVGHGVILRGEWTQKEVGVLAFLVWLFLFAFIEEVGVGFVDALLVQFALVYTVSLLPTLLVIIYVGALYLIYGNLDFDDRVWVGVASIVLVIVGSLSAVAFGIA